ncbi:FUSC family protein OS=Streptomyces microflavus OX=1919 GN=G3I39_41415 PE=4 SV=1 [Streptomyces microflavus]
MSARGRSDARDPPELDIDERPKRLGEELDRRSAEAHERHPRLRSLIRRLSRVTT